MIKYGIISDVHEDPRIVRPTIEILKSQGAEKLILNGDIGNSQEFVGYVLNQVGLSNLETYVQTGSHEKLEDFEPVIKYFQEKYSNLINVFNNQKISNDQHHLVFLPGTDFFCGGQYILENNSDIQSGFYETVDGLIRLMNINDLEKLVSNPDKTIIFSHVPRKFDNLDYGVDMAEFGEVSEDFILNEKKVGKSSVFPFSSAYCLYNQGFPIVLKKENRGNLELKKIYEKLGIKKSVTGHFHESGHRACDRRGDFVEDGKSTDELFWNSGYCDIGQTGILSVNEHKVSYQNINLKDYL
jgi:hypothetical protein